MDDKLFKELLSQVAHWRIPETITSTTTGDAKPKPKRGRGRPTKEEQYQKEHQEIFLEIYEGVNPTFPPQLLKLKHQGQVCADCGKECSQKKERKLYEANKKRHWREKCVTCGLHQNPYTGKFDLESQRASLIWNNFLRDTKGLNKSKGNIAKDQGIIRIYPQENKTE